MIVRVERRQNPFVQIERSTLQDERLTWRARGLLAYLLSLPTDWTINFEHLAKRSPASAYQVRKTFKELEAHGYATLVRPRGRGGLVKGSHWVIFETPRLRKQPPRSTTPSTEVAKNRISDNAPDRSNAESRETAEVSRNRPPTYTTSKEVQKERQQTPTPQSQDYEPCDVVDLNKSGHDERGQAQAVRHLTAKGVVPKVAHRLVHTYGVVAVRTVLKHVAQVGDKAPGWIVSAIQEGWTFPGVTTKAPAQPLPPVGPETLEEANAWLDALIHQDGP